MFNLQGVWLVLSGILNVRLLPHSIQLCGGICHNHVLVLVSGPSRQLTRLKSSQNEPKSEQTVTQTVEGKETASCWTDWFFFFFFNCLKSHWNVDLWWLVLVLYFYWVLVLKSFPDLPHRLPVCVWKLLTYPDGNIIENFLSYLHTVSQHSCVWYV